MAKETAQPTDHLVAIACWANLALSVFALLCAVFLGMLLLSNGGPWSPNMITFLIYAALPWIYQTVLSRAHWHTHPQFEQAWLYAILVFGAAALAVLAVNIVGIKGASHPVILVPFLIGCLSFSAVARITFQRKQAAES